MMTRICGILLMSWIESVSSTSTSSDHYRGRPVLRLPTVLLLLARGRLELINYWSMLTRMPAQVLVPVQTDRVPPV